MPYNKNQFRKVNDKKVLHKVKSHWVAVSLSLLMALGGTAVAGQAVHADNNVNLGNQNSVNHQISSPDSKLSFTDGNGTMSDYQTPTQVGAIKAAPETETGTTERITPQYVNHATEGIVPRYVNSANDADNSLNAEINALKQSASVQPNIAPSSASSRVIPKSSASHKSASNSASSNDNIISFVSGDNGSAASYHAKASANQSLYQINSSLAEHYMNSLNANFGVKTSSLNNNYSTLASKYNRDQSVANTYFNIANSTGYSQEVASLAAENGQTASNYVQSISYQASNFANNLSQGNNLKSQMAVVNSYAQLINNLHSNSNLRVTYSLKAQSADYALGVEDAYSAGFSSVASALNTASSAAGGAMLSAIVNSMDASASNAIANINVNRDNSLVSSLASALSYGTNTFSVNSMLSNYAASFNADSNSNLTFRAQNGTYSNVAYNADSSDDIYNLLDDMNIKATYGSRANSYENVIRSAKSAQTSLSGAISSADADVQSESSKYSAISSRAAFYDVLSNPQVGLNNIFGSTSSAAISNSASANVNDVNSTVTNLLNQDISSSASVLDSVHLPASTVQSAVSLTVPNVISAVARDNNLIDANGNITNVASLASDLKNEASSANSVISDGVSFIKHDGSLGEKLMQGSGLTFNELYQKIANYQDIEPNIYQLSQLLLAPAANDPSLSSQVLVTPQLAADILHNGSNNVIQNAINGLVNSPEISQIVAALGTHGNQLMQESPQNYVGVSNEVYASAPETGQADVLGQQDNSQVQGRLLNPQSYAAASNAVSVYTNNNQNDLSYNVSAISSVANSASSVANSAASASEAYDNSTDVSTALAGSLLGRYDDIVYNDQQSLSAAKGSLTDFYNQYAPGYTSASSTAASASAAAPIAAKLAQAYGMHVYNYAPKYITAIKDVALRSSLDSNNSQTLATIKRGQDRIYVNGVGFDRDGNTYYAVTYNGQDGYVTANPNVTKNSYLFATPNNHATVTFLHSSYEYNSVAFNKNTIVKPVKAGEQRSGVIVSEDGNYGGWTRIRLDDGNYITANTSWIDIDLNNNSSNNNGNNSNHHSNVVPQNKVNFS